MSSGHVNPVGGTVESFEVLGREYDGERRWTGADMSLNVSPFGRFFLNVVTKNHFSAEEVERALDTDEAIRTLLEAFKGAEVEETKPPFVLNDDEITDEILHEKFDNRIVKSDLAACLWYEPSTE